MSQQLHTSKTASPSRKMLSGGLLGLLLVIFLASFLYASFLFFRTARGILVSSPQASQTLLAASNQSGNASLTDSSSAPAPGGAGHDAALPANRPNSAPDFAIDSLWESQEPVNILLLGIDQRPGEHGYYRTDTMILLHINPKSGDVGMISFPRDLWVEVPGFWKTRINSAHVIGDAKKYPGGGPELAKKTVENLIGQPVDYYVRINFEGFRKLLEKIGCIDIDVPKLIDDPTFPDDNYGYDPLYLEPGHYCMDADLALKYARTRHVDSDFGRMQRQQQVIMAVKDKLLNTGELPHLVTSAPAMLNILSDSIQTDMPLGEMIALANSARHLNLNNIRRLIIDVNMVEPTITEKGAAVLLPKMDLIQAAIDEFFAADAEQAQSEQDGKAIIATETPSSRVEAQPPTSTPVQKDARIVILNGAATPGQEKTLADILIAHGYDVVGTGQADRSDYAQTQIIASDNAEVVSQLADLLSVSDQNIRPGASGQLQADIVVIIGADFVLP